MFLIYKVPVTIGTYVWGKSQSGDNIKENSGVKG